MSTTASPAVGFRKLSVPAALLLLALAWLLPFLVHLIPWSGARPLGAYLLPMFWATLVAVYLYGAALGVVIGLFGPLINLLVAGASMTKFISPMSLELAAFALAFALALRFWPRFWMLAPLAYLVARAVSTAFQSVVPSFGQMHAGFGAFFVSLGGVLPGLMVLLVINAALVRFYPRAGKNR